MPDSKFSDLDGCSIEGSQIQSVKEEQDETIHIQTVDGQWFQFPNLTHVYPQLDPQRSGE